MGGWLITKFKLYRYRILWNDLLQTSSNNSGDVSKLLYWGRFAFRSNADITRYHQIERKYHHIIWLHPGPIYSLHQLEMQNCDIWFHGTIDMWIYPLKVAYFTKKIGWPRKIGMFIPPDLYFTGRLKPVIFNGFMAARTAPRQWKALGSEAPLRSSWSRWAWIQHLGQGCDWTDPQVFTGFLECAYISYIITYIISISAHR